jgi:UDP-N-acetylmuramate dehydrogenase
MMSFQENIQISHYTTIHTGGPARWFAACATAAEIIDALNFASSNKLSVLTLGAGSNLLVSDKGFDGLVIQVALNGLDIDDTGLVTAGAGVSWDALVKATCLRGLIGLEAMSGIPGLVGATPVQNVGAYGQEVSDTIVQVKALHKTTLGEHIFSAKECAFSYRQSRFKSSDRDQWIITEVTFQLNPSSPPTPRYDELQTSLASDQRWLTGDRTQKILAVRDHVIKIRSAKGMVLDSTDPDTRSLGSFFVNPIVTTSDKERVFQVASQRGIVRLPVAHPTGDNLWKLSAAWLIENSGIKKGDVLGHARVSTKHVLAITNPQKATTSEILALAHHIQTRVREAFGIELTQEPVRVD